MLLACGGTAPDVRDALQPLRPHAVALGELARFEAAYGPLQTCRLELASLRWEQRSAADLGRLCATGRALSGCFRYEPPDGIARAPVIALSDAPRSDEQQLRAQRHELRHWLLQCGSLDPTGDPAHAGPWWSNLL